MTARRLVVGVAALAVVMIGWNAFMASREGWVPEGDGATITLRTHDVLSAHPPLLGNPTTAGRIDAGEQQHPDAADARPGRHEQARPDARRQRPEPPREADHQQRDRQQ